MLGQRILTAVVLLALLIPAVLSSAGWPFALLTIALIAAAGWEWGRLNAAAPGLALLFGALMAAFCGAAWWADWSQRVPASVWWVAGAIWVLGGAVALRASVVGWPALPLLLRWCLGLLALAIAWLALVAAKASSLAFLMSIFCLVWVADIAAYFGGRRFGKRKLAPRISPGKSWAGAYSGAAGALLLAVAWLAVERSLDMPLAGTSLFSRLEAQWGLAGMLIAVGALAAMSVVGDLVESLVKRSSGAKDSSGLLPGHGGVLDRIDALLPVFPLALALTT